MAEQQKAAQSQPAGKVLRFTGGERFSHWVHAVSFFLLLFTGLGVLSLFFRPALTIVGGIQVARIIHRVMAVVFVAGTGAMFFINHPKYHWEWLRSAFRFTEADKKHIKAFVVEFFGGHGNYPPQAKYNGGEKINSLFTIFGSILITVSGIVMWVPQYFPTGLVQFAYPIHDLAMFMMTTAVIGHMYLSLLHPESRAALSGMVNGYVSEKFAKAHHAAWYEETQQYQKAAK
ncbi:MAG TPA: cytochrome b/b6 domain-containing protein [Verrucomicrobiae bacterium]|nr:cytochrome b/b6 domain-containing protein [Verrucomicrobiae bacterium]